MSCKNNCNCKEEKEPIGLTYDMIIEKYLDHYELLDSPPFAQQITRKDMPVFSGVLKYFPDALKEVSRCSKAGNDQHHAEKPLHWDKSKSTDNEDALTRHLIDHGQMVDNDQHPVDDDGILHLSKVAWRALASLQIFLEKNQ